jgi:hypothetical protein
LCGTGVISNIADKFTPPEIKPLIACSLPIPIHLTYTSTVSIECRVFAFEIAVSATTCAA